MEIDDVTALWPGSQRTNGTFEATARAAAKTKNCSRSPRKVLYFDLETCTSFSTSVTTTRPIFKAGERSWDSF